MLPAAKVLLVTVLLGGGTVGTYALVGGKFGTGGNGTGNAETTTQVSTPVPDATNPSAQRDSGAGNDGQAQQQNTQTNNQADSQPQSVGGVSGGRGVDEEPGVQSDATRSASHVEQEITSSDSQTGPQGIKSAGSKEVQSATENGKTNPESDGAVSDPSDTNPEGTPGASITSQQGVSEANAGETGPSETISPTDPNLGSQEEASVNNGDGAKGTGQGTDGEETRTASGEEETRTQTGDQSV